MSISSVQRKKKTDEFSMELVQKGIKPNAYEVGKMLTEHFDNHVAGMPYYSPIKQEKYGTSSKKDYNHNFETLNEDLEVIYMANVEANNTAVAMQEYYDSERDKVMGDIEKLSMRIRNISEAMKNGERSKQYVETFDTLYNIDYYGDNTRNIPATSCFIDLLQKNAYNNKMNSNVNKLDISSATVTINGGKIKSGDASNILDDIFNDYVIIEASDISPTTEKSIEVIIDLGQEMIFDSVLFRFTSASNMSETLYLSEDGNTYVPTYTNNASLLSEWTFPEKRARFLKIICLKDSCDSINQDADSEHYRYVYYFLFKNISVAYEKYTKKSCLVTKQIDMGDLISELFLDSDDMTFSHTSIDYFIGYDNGKDKVGWDVLNNHSIHPLEMFEKKHKIANVNVDGFGDPDISINCYKVINIPKNINKNTIRVTPGYNMWMVNKYNHYDGNTEAFSLSTGDFSDFVNNCDCVKMFMDCENYTNFTISANSLYIFTQYVSMDRADVLFNKTLMVTKNGNPIDNAQIRVFVNGYETSSCATNKYTFNLKKGVNKIQIAIYCFSTTVEDYKLIHKVNFKDLTNDVFSSTPLKYTNHGVIKNAKEDSYEYYTIKDNAIYVKDDPTNIVRSELEEMPYFISYYSLKPELTGLFPDGHVKFRIMAVMNTTDNTVSPRITGFRISGR